MNLRSLGVCLLALVLAPQAAYAVRAPDHLRGHPDFEVAQGGAARLVRQVAWNPTWSHPDWDQFTTAVGGEWRSLWDLQTLVPLRIWGSGIPAAQATGSAAAAERHARKLLAKYIDLLAPGASPGDFVLASNNVFRGVRTVGFLQHHRGRRVLTGQLSFRFKHDRLLAIGSEALPWVTSRAPASRVSADTARRRALAWIEADFAAAGSVTAVTGPVVLPIIRRGAVPGEVEYADVLVVKVRSDRPLGRWEVYIDAVTGEPVARHQRLRFFQGTIQFNAPDRWWGDTRSDYPAVFADVTIDGTGTTTDATGMVSWTSQTPASIDLVTSGTFVTVVNDAGAEAGTTLTLTDGVGATWNDETTEFVDAQTSSYVHAMIAKEYARVLNPGLTWLDDQVVVTVNIDDFCNAASDGTDLFFIRAAGPCGNTARIADVVYHEFGHSLHFHSLQVGVGFFDGALSEGASDYYSATLTEDPAMGRGFFNDSDPLRHIDPAGREYVWPDDISGDTHATGLIFAGAMWDLRKDLISQMGQAAGKALTDRLFYAALQRASDIPSAYVDIITEDDDDGDLSNGTPNICTIQRNFALHGITDPPLTGGLFIDQPVIDGFNVAIDVVDPGTGCGTETVTAAFIAWEERDNSANSGTIDLTPNGSTYEGQVPTDNDGVVIRYQVVVELSDGSSKTYPENRADPFFEAYVGDVVPIYCTDFETDPELDGWTHGLTAGQPGPGADDWTWGVPQGEPGSGDPGFAHSGQAVYGNDLGGGNNNGRYQRNKINFTETHQIDVTGFDGVRLQYWRWLTVEDGFFDQATIYANSVAVWQNFNSNMGNNSNIHHEDKVWRFHDVELTDHVSSDGTVLVKWEIQSDEGLQLGGWTLDDVCVVGTLPHVCGDGVLTSNEACDDGSGNSDLDPDACRSDCTVARCGDGVVDTGEECDDGNILDTDKCSNLCEKKKSGCSCEASGADDSSGLALVFGFALLFLGWSRRRRQ